jgi:hypothetical protein
VNHRLTSRKLDLKSPLNVAHSSDIQLQFYSLEKMLTNRVNDTEASLAFARHVTGKEDFADFRILSEQNFHDVEFWGAQTRGATSTLTLGVGQSSRVVEPTRKFRDGDTSGRVSTCLCSVH